MAGNKRILIIEDEAVQLQVLSEKLVATGFSVLQATDGKQGLSKALANQPDLILLDNKMPAMGGFEMLTRLRENDGWGQQVPVIFFSNVEPQSKEEWHDIESAGAAYYLIKGDTSLEELVAKIKEVLAS